MMDDQAQRIQAMTIRAKGHGREAASFGQLIKNSGAVQPVEINALSMRGDKKAGPFKPVLVCI